jgi:hypothetical protein
MTEQCSRCGRPRPVGPAAEQVSAQLLPFVGKADEGWSSFGGHPACPQCQTAEERQEVKYRVIGAIELEIERRRREAIAPDALEAHLVMYAMQLREELSSQEGVCQTSLDDMPHSSGGQRGRAHCVAFTAAFLTRHALAVHLDSYRALQLHLGSYLKAPQWRTEGLDGSGGTYSGPWGGGFSEALPLVIARREGADLLPLLRDLRECQLTDESLENHGPVLALEPHSLVVDIYDLGVGVLSACMAVRADPAASLPEIARAIKGMAGLRLTEGGRPRLADDIARITAAVEREYGEAVVASSVKTKPTWLANEAALSLDYSVREVPSELAELGRLLWLHPVHVLRKEPNLELDKAAAGDLAPPFSNLLEINRGVFAAGVGWSAVIVSGESDAAATPLRLTQLHWAYYALYMAIDRGLLEILHQERWSKSSPLWRLELDAGDVFADYLRIVDARARLDSHLASLGGDDFAVWETIARVQRFDALESAVDHKIDALQTVAQRRVEQANAYRAHRTGDALGFLAVLTLITLAGGATVMLFGAGTPPRLEVWQRAMIVFFSAVLALLVFWIFFWRTARAPWGSRQTRSGRDPASQGEVWRRLVGGRQR